MPKITFNGRFLNAPQTGVQRVARELIVSMLSVLDEHPDLKQKLAFELVSPPNPRSQLSHAGLTSRAAGNFSGQIWEQATLPNSHDGDLLVNLCNLSPLQAKNAITMIHDAQVFLSPESYSLAFRTWYRFMLPRIGKSARKILTVSNYSADQLVAFGIAPREKIAVVHNGVDHILDHAPDPDIVAKLGLTPQGYAVGLASTQPHKNIQVLLDAYRDPRLGGYKLVLFGPAERQDFIDAGLDLPDSVIVASWLSDAELRALYENAHAVVFPSKTEGFGLPPLEGMTLGIPAICANAGALPEVCGDAAIYADPNDVEAWINQIVTLVNEPPEARAARSEACKKQASAYTWHRAGERLLQVIVDELDL